MTKAPEAMPNLSAANYTTSQNLMMEIGDRIKAARAKRGMTQEQLAAALGVNKSAVAQWETTSSARKGITTQNVVAAARILQVRPSELMDDLSDDDELRTSDPEEIALIQLFRRMAGIQREAHLRLFYVSVGLEALEKPGSHPSKRQRVAPGAAAKKTA